MSDLPQFTHEFEHLRLRQRVTMMVNRYEIHRSDAAGNEVGMLCFAEQKRMTFKEQVTFYGDSGKRQPLFSFKARKVIDFGSGYDVVDAVGTPIGFFRKDFRASLGNSTWHLSTPDGLECTGRERNETVAILRRIWEVVPVLGELWVPWLFHFDFRAGDGSIVFSSTRKPAMRDVYQLELPAQPNGWRLDWRVAAAMAVALDALQSR